jgi:hypothetical protein
MSKYARGIVFAMEDADLDTSVGSGEDLAELESSTAEIETEARDIDDGVEALDSAMEDMDTLEDISDVMEDSVEEGTGLDENAAEIAQVAVESIYRRLGLRNARPMPSLESLVLLTRASMRLVSPWKKSVKV